MPENDTFALEKKWLDGGADVQLVELRYAWSATGEQPDWATGEQCRVMVPAGDDSGQTERRCVVELPRGIAGSGHYTWHYYFLVIVNGRQRTTTPVSETIVSREIAFPDDAGHYASATLQWGVDALLNLTELSASEATRPYLSAAAAMPFGGSPEVRPTGPQGGRAFRGRVWGVRGSPLRYVFRLRRAEGENAWDCAPDADWLELS